MMKNDLRHYPSFIVSAKTNENVVNCFNEILKIYLTEKMEKII
jgi:hypothetical protein